MSAYIYCPKCNDDSLDVDTLCCECGFNVHGRIDALEKALYESERISKSWKVQWENLLQDERKEKALRCSLQDSLSEIREVWAGSDGGIMLQTDPDDYLARLMKQCYEIAGEALKK